ncbi:MAG TPA: sulfur carrier protein ThiS [Candidatus Hydrogenedens sp.]|nr:sulfur carrier protein ThiS [Candidatus Hydrogenedens sp.]HOK08442.1 sulfur carrier protein ThiS [Candidatus Hydrogenedens sp.]HOL20293.1 sulfur carrier protein ThiS [Candidatus Hydrogenedens sp.]HPP58145.1 sulfur carrier protein ThiS [Candidatus Hydrogenedens sp.]
MIRVIVNDEETLLPDGANISTLLKEKNLEGKTVVVVINDEIVEHTKYDITYLKEGDQIEIVRIVGGG